jgi:hypothetical protein
MKFLESKGAILRNVLLVTYPYGPSDFDTIMDVNEQERWRKDLLFVDNAGDRLQDELQRSKFHRRYLEFLSRPHATEVLEILHKYITVGIPAFRRSEMSFWSCTCLPAGNKYEADLFRLNIYKQEVFTCRCFLPNKSFLFFLHLSKSWLQRGGYWFWLRFWRHQIFITYPSGGDDQIRLHIHGIDQLNNSLNDPRFIRAIREFNIQLMKRGPNLNSRSHCLDLVDIPTGTP